MRSYRIRRDMQVARLSVAAAINAAWRGRMDGRRPITTRDGRNGWTPFVGQACARADATSSQMITRLLDDHKALVSSIYRQAESVNRIHAAGRSAHGARGRFVASLNQWRAEAVAARYAAESAVNVANQVIACYWQAFLRNYPLENGTTAKAISGWQPDWAVLDPIWDKVDTLLLLTFGQAEDEATTQAGGVLRNALDIVANCNCQACT